MVAHSGRDRPNPIPSTIWRCVRWTQVLSSKRLESARQREGVAKGKGRKYKMRKIIGKEINELIQSGAPSNRNGFLRIIFGANRQWLNVHRVGQFVSWNPAMFSSKYFCNALIFRIGNTYKTFHFLNRLHRRLCTTPIFVNVESSMPPGLKTKETS